MRTSKRAMRRAVLCRLFEHLEEQYGIDWTKDAFVDGRLSLHQVDAILAFKSDRILSELRAALDRLEDGTYGFCLRCKGEISQDLLDPDPTRRFCSACEHDTGRALAGDLHLQQSA